MDKTIQYLFNLRPEVIKPGLDRIRKLLDYLGNPERKFHSIHVAGTNGKGSVCAILHSVLKEAGYKTGRYTSPHLLRFNERIVVGNKMIGDSYIIDFINSIKNKVERIDASFFEVTTALAFKYFAENNIDVAVIEVGMGGRWDATNVVNPIVSIITSISRDHQEYLGDKLLNIAMEKFGIVKSGVNVVFSRQHPRIKSYFIKKCKESNFKYVYAPDIIKVKVCKIEPSFQVVDIITDNKNVKSVKFPLIGKHQVDNLKASLAALESLSRNGFCEFNEDILKKGMEEINWKARLELLNKNPLIYYDVAHNESGFDSVLNTLKEVFPDKKIDIIMAVKKTKNIDLILKRLVKVNGNVYIISNFNGFYTFNELKPRLKRLLNFTAGISELKNIGAFLRSLSIRDERVLLITGSHYIANDVYSAIRANAKNN